METQKPLPTQDAFRIQWIIWGALSWSYFMYGFVAIKKIGAGVPSEDWEQAALVKSLGLIALGFLFLTHFLSKKIFLVSVRSQTDLDEGLIIARAIIPNIISWALTESIAIFGLFLTFKTNDMIPYYLFASVAFANMLILRPSKEKWLTLAKQNGSLRRS